MKDTIVALSGGVDSGVAAALLLEHGDTVRGLFMRHRYQQTLDAEETRRVLAANFNNPRLTFYRVDSQGRMTRLQNCATELPFLLPIDAVAAIDVANYLNIGLIILDIDDPFGSIVENFVDEYYSAHTPNPCVLCNRTIKFGLLVNVAWQLGADCFATGHYVRKIVARDWLERESITNKNVDAYWGFDAQQDYKTTPSWLCNNLDLPFFARSVSQKDQSYFLYSVKTENLQRIEFPIGAFAKETVRLLAREKGLPIATRKDSQEVCFVPNKQHVEFIHSIRACDSERWNNIPSDTSGPFLSMEGKTIGKHLGYEKYTIGQRKGLGMGFGERIFVQRIIPEQKAVVLGPHEALGTNVVRAVESNWHASVPVEEDFRCEVKVRYRNESCFATLRVACDGSVVARLDSPRFGVAPGQALVCYWRDRLLGGAKIVGD